MAGTSGVCARMTGDVPVGAKATAGMSIEVGSAGDAEGVGGAWLPAADSWLVWMGSVLLRSSGVIATACASTRGVRLGDATVEVLADASRNTPPGTNAGEEDDGTNSVASLDGTNGVDLLVSERELVGDGDSAALDKRLIRLRADP